MASGFAGKPLRGKGGGRMWDVVRDAIQSTGRTLRFIAILVVLALVAWVVSPH